jgi:hypothetical protein
MEWTRLPDGDLFVAEEFAFVTERSSTGCYRCTWGQLPGWEATGQSKREVFGKVVIEIAQRRLDGRLPSHS